MAGQVRWVNHPRRRSDGRMLPDASGIVQTDDGARVMFRMQGRTVFGTNPQGERKGGSCCGFCSSRMTSDISG